jgi:hypothetical protein
MMVVCEAEMMVVCEAVRVVVTEVTDMMVAMEVLLVSSTDRLLAAEGR